MTDFEKCTTTTRTKYGWAIRCRLCNWGVEAPSLEQARGEAMNYWRKYFSDGEYDSLLGSEK